MITYTVYADRVLMPAFDHGAAAASTLYWYAEDAWWRYDTADECWRGWAVKEGADGPSISLATEKPGPVTRWRPWTATLDASEAPTVSNVWRKA